MLTAYSNPFSIRKIGFAEILGKITPQYRVLVNRWLPVSSDRKLDIYMETDFIGFFLVMFRPCKTVKVERNSTNSLEYTLRDWIFKYRECLSVLIYYNE